MEGMTDIASLRVAAKAERTHALLPVLVEAVVEKASKDGKPFLEVQLCDARDRFVLRVWSDSGQFAAVQSLTPGACLELKGDFQVHPVFGLEAKNWSFSALLGQTKEEFLAGPADLRARQEEDFQLIVSLVAGMKEPRLKSLGQTFLEKFGSRFQRTAAARFFHHARRGGLVEHVAQMMRYADAISLVNTSLHRDLLLCGVLFHDCGKLWENCVEEGGFTMTFDERGELLGHINIGIELINSLWKTLPLNDWEGLVPENEDVRLHLLHLVAAHHGELAFGSPVQPKTPEAIALHYIDNLDAKLEMLARGYEGGPSVAERIYDKVRPLNVRLVAPLAPLAAP